MKTKFTEKQNKKLQANQKQKENFRKYIRKVCK